MSVWFPPSIDSRIDASPEDLEVEPLEDKAVRVFKVIREFAAQDEYPFAAMRIDGHEMVMMNMAWWMALISSVDPSSGAAS